MNVRWVRDARNCDDAISIDGRHVLPHPFHSIAAFHFVYLLYRPYADLRLLGIYTCNFTLCQGCG